MDIRMHSVSYRIVFILLACCVSPFESGRLSAAGPDSGGHTSSGTDQAAAPYQRGRGTAARGVYKTRITPHWFDGGRRFWYRNDLRDGQREFVLVDAEAGLRRPAFDHDRLAKALSDAGVTESDAERLPLSDLAFDFAENAVEFRAGDAEWRCDLKSYELTRLEKRTVRGDDEETLEPAGDAPRASARTGPETSLTFVNRTDGRVELFWLDPQGRRRSYGEIPPNGEHEQHTYAGHVWLVVDEEGRTLAVFEADEGHAVAEITKRSGNPDARRPRERRGRRAPQGRSPDGRWTAVVRDHNVILQSEADGSDVPLTTNGTEDASYGRTVWSSDSQRLVALRTTPAETGEVYLVESSPPGGGRARLHTRPYALPGDKYPVHDLVVFDVAGRTALQPDVDPIDFGQPRIRWSRDGQRFTYEKVDRGHQRFRLIEVNARTAAVRTLIDERTETFIWTAHTESRGVPLITWLDETDELIYASERDGWRHLYLLDAAPARDADELAGGGGSEPEQASDSRVDSTEPSHPPELRRITRGEWVVRGIDHVDEQQRQIWFRASGRHPDQDPYFIHYYRINFDGTGLVALTAGDGHHTVRFSPDRRFLIDTYSRVDLPPVHELRRTSDGELVCELERADITELEETGWQSPEVFHAQGRDGETDIWGIICRPADFDPGKKYPVIEQIYAGPQGAFVPKSFSPAQRFSSLTDLGFVVVQIDGMGTAHRSKAFHDVCWQNLKDAGLPDRILWHRAVAEKHPWYDISRVGIYGGSAGGQNAAAAVLFHPEFYDVAVAGCGCHDNRMDKASWNEQWMGYPVGPHYAECSNIEHAQRLQGKLLLIVGEMDTNVPPESTLRFADALIRADKDFDLVLVPGAGHGMGGRYGERRMRDFFVRHLHGIERADRSADVE